MSLRIKYKDNSILLIRYFPKYSSIILGFGILLAITVFLLFEGVALTLPGIAIGIVFIWLIVDTLRERELQCIINRRTGTITYTKCGVFGSKYSVQHVQHHITEITALEIVRYASRGRDTFQIRLALMGSCTLRLSSANLDFYECQICASKIHEFVGLGIPLRAIG